MIPAETGVQEACSIDLGCCADRRRGFVRTWCREEFSTHGLTARFVQEQSPQRKGL